MKIFGCLDHPEQTVGMFLHIQLLYSGLNKLLV
uniref:Uncharacterized protein n=1 Tax=Arundo donax TaxID=35708 RepID=A0A0A8Z9F0_ARUDO